MKNLTILASVFVLVASFGFASLPQSANAMCSDNGYSNSGGKCENSYKWEKKNWDDDDEDEDDDDDYSWKKKKGNWNQYQYQYQKNYDLDYLQAYINQLIALLAAYHGGVNATTGDVDARTQSATDITEDSATLRAVIEFDTDDEAELYFEYGTKSGSLTKKTDRIELTDSDDGDTIEDEIDGLTDDTKYFFRAVAVDEDGDKDYGTILSFITDGDGTDDDTNDEDPVVTTSAERNVDNDSADLRGTIDMNDFENGVAFFVFGEDEDQIDDVESDYDSYTDVDEDGDDLRKSQVDTDVDATETYTQNVSGLDTNTEIFFALCVAYEDEDDDETLECGKTRSFDTE